MGAYISKKLVQQLIKKNRQIPQTKVLVMGATFKENVSDIRNSKVVDVIRELRNYSVNVEVVDPFADHDDFQHEYDIDLVKEAGTDYDAVIIAVNHEQYSDLKDADFKKILKEDGVIVDVKGTLRSNISAFEYWSL